VAACCPPLLLRCCSLPARLVHCSQQQRKCSSKSHILCKTANQEDARDGCLKEECTQLQAEHYIHTFCFVGTQHAAAASCAAGQSNDLCIQDLRLVIQSC
jgi:hypothetical protein